MALYKTKGIVLGSRPFEETGKLVTFFTPDRGKLSIIAKGSKRPTSRFGGRLETFSYGEILAAAGRNLDILSQMEVIESFQQIREIPAFLSIGFYFIRIVKEATLEGHPNSRLYKLLLTSLKKIIDGEKLDYIVKFFEINFLRVEGLYRKDKFAEDLIAEHLQKDVKWWKNQVLAQDLQQY